MNTTTTGATDALERRAAPRRWIEGKTGALALGALALSVAWAPAVSAATFTVTKTADTADGTCDADCSLREAVIAANALAGADTITIPTGTYVLTLTGLNEDASLTGDLDLLDPVSIQGAGAGATVIDGNAADRVFHNLTPTVDPVAISGVTIQNGRAVSAGINQGGAILNEGQMTLSASVLTGNTASQAGGAISNLLRLQAAILTVASSSIVGNTTNGDGGGISSDATVSSLDDVLLQVFNSTIADNQAGTLSSDLGDGIWVGAGTALIENSTLSDNFGATGEGLTVSSAEATLRNVTVYGRVRTGGATAPITFANTIVDGSCVGSSAGRISLGGNLQTGTNCNFTQPTDQSGVASALLGPLGQNGGPTDTHRLLFGSPAIDAADDALCAAVDQRFVTRPLDGDLDTIAHCDVGAFEVDCMGPDGDGDGVPDACDNCPADFNPTQDDGDVDGVGDVCDACTDVDEDGWGDPGSAGCTFPELDCNDADPDVNPGAAEILGNGIDDDCNPATSDCADLDLDGYGDPASTECTFPEFDCNDADAGVNPGAAEIPGTNVDEDCDPATSDCRDLDLDGYGSPGSIWCTVSLADCDDTNPNVSPGVVEIPGNGIDDDCNPLTGGCPGTIASESLGSTASETGGTSGAGSPLVALAAVALAVRVLRRRG